MGCVISALGAIFLATRGYSGGLAGLLAVGIVLLVLGIFWK